jgi:hypothetical protein
MDTMVQAVHDFRGTFHISDYRWFDLRDSNSQSPNFQQQYGLMTDEYVPKPAFGLYRKLVGRFTAGVPSPRLRLYRSCRGRTWRAHVRGSHLEQVRRVSFRIGDLRARPDADVPFERSFSARGLRRGGAGQTLRAVVRLAGGKRLRLARALHHC